MSRKSNNEVLIESLETQYKTVITDGCAQQTALMGADTTTTAAHMWPLITQIVATNQSIANRNGTQEDAYIEDMNEWTICEEVVVVKEEKEWNIESTEDKSLTVEDIVNDRQIIETDTGSDGCVDNTNDEIEIKKETEDTDCKPIITDEYIDDRTVTTNSWPLVTEIQAINHSIVDTFLTHITQEDRHIEDTNEFTIPEEVVVKEEVNEGEEESALVMSASVLRQQMADKADQLTDPSTSLPLKLFACDYEDCDFRAINQSLLDSHRESHKTFDLFCGYEDCGRSFMHERALKIHQNKSRHFNDTDDMAIAGPPYGCQWPDCAKAFKAKWLLKRHVDQVHKGVRQFACHDCPQRFAKKSSLCLHRRQKHSLEPIVKKEFKCDYNDCQFETNISGSLRRHRKSHLNIKEFVSEETTSFVTNGDLKRHMRRHSDERPHPCQWPDCTKPFSTLWKLKRHVDQVHKGVRPFACHDCPKWFQSCSHLRKHRRQKHSLELIVKKVFKCDFISCEFETTGSSALNDHKKRHLNIKEFVCEETDCAASFITNGDLMRHMRSHSDERPHRCDWPGCEAAYKQANTLTIHRRKHHTRDEHSDGSDNKRFKCDVSGCSYGSNSRSSFVSHELKHQNVRPFVCEETDCGKSFSRKDSLNRHKRCHSDERPYRCDWPACESAYKLGPHLADHRRTHTGEREYKCPFAGCGKCYATRSILN
ncbi:unnamed protein product, partial [Medioppia subpectinata]